MELNTTLYVNQELPYTSVQAQVYSTLWYSYTYVPAKGNTVSSFSREAAHMAPRLTSSFSRNNKHCRGWHRSDGIVWPEKDRYTGYNLLKNTVCIWWRNFFGLVWKRQTYLWGIAGPLVAHHLALETEVVVAVLLLVLRVCVHHNVHLIPCRGQRLRFKGQPLIMPWVHGSQLLRNH